MLCRKLVGSLQPFYVQTSRMNFSSDNGVIIFYLYFRFYFPQFPHHNLLIMHVHGIMIHDTRLLMHHFSCCASNTVRRYYVGVGCPYFLRIIFLTVLVLKMFCKFTQPKIYQLIISLCYFFARDQP